MPLDERDYFTETTELKPMSIVCPQCGHRADYPIQWIHRAKKTPMPTGGESATFDQLRDHLFRIDDVVTCARCRCRVDIPSQQSIVFL